MCRDRCCCRPSARTYYLVGPGGLAGVAEAWSMSRRTPTALGDPERLAAVKRAAILDTPADATFDQLASLASRVLGAPIALVSILDDHRQFLKSAVGMPEPWASARETPLTHSKAEVGRRLAPSCAWPLHVSHERLRHAGVASQRRCRLGPRWYGQGATGRCRDHRTRRRRSG